MKTTRAAILLFACLFLIRVASAQDAALQSQDQKTEQSAENREKRLRQEERAKSLMKKKPLLFGGFFADASRSEKKLKQFSLRTARNPERDYRNIAFEERTGRPRGFVLFRLEF
jgi:hypothetical protein